MNEEAEAAVLGSWDRDTVTVVSWLDIRDRVDSATWRVVWHVTDLAEASDIYEEILEAVDAAVTEGSK
jgi:hypothetical protein